MMQWPELVPDAVCTTPITVQLEDGLNEDGSPRKTTLFSGGCNYTQKTQQKTDAERRVITITGVALMNGDPAPGVSIIGTALIGENREPHLIHQSQKATNPDGTVNYTRLELI